MDHATNVLVLLGPPGSGKGTQAARLAQEMGCVPISTGELLRREVDSGSEIGQQVHNLLAAGLLVGNDLMNAVVTKRIADDDCARGCILDGYPRTLEQARFLDHLLRSKGIEEPVVLDFVVSPETVIERLSLRRQCPHCGKIYGAEFDVYGKDLLCEDDGTPLVRRSDDNPQTIRERLTIYETNSHELVAFYRPRRYFAVDAMRSPDEISLQLLTLMHSIAARKSTVVEPSVLSLSGS
jgi:adenylate kinase